MPTSNPYSKIKHILLDIEGTICPISFVKTTLFPYALATLPHVLASQWSSPSFQPYITAFPAEHRATPAALLAHVQDLTRRDVKAAPLKNLQGYLWRTGYESGAYATPLFEDVLPCLRRWTSGDEGRRTSVYSSGSVAAQKLLFGHVSAAAAATAAVDSRDRAQVTDETGLISEWFDTTNAGLKTESASYERIVGVLGEKAAEVLFLSDNVVEVRAALKAGMRAVVVDRVGNAPLSERDVEELRVVTSFDQIELD